MKKNITYSILVTFMVFCVVVVGNYLFNDDGLSKVAGPLRKGHPDTSPERGSVADQPQQLRPEWPSE